MIKVASSVFDITPQMPTYMAGYFTRTEHFKSVHDPIEGVMLWLEVDGIKNLWIILDLSNLDYDFVEDLQDRISQCCPVDKDKIVIGATHNHAGPVIVTRNANQPVTPEYRSYVKSQIIHNAVCTVGQEQEVSSVIYTHGISKGFYGNRNGEKKYGDNHIHQFEFKDASEKNIAAIINLSCHCTVLGQEQYELSGDLFAALRRKMIPHLAVAPLVINGNAADMSNRMYRQGNGYCELERISTGIVEQILSFTEKQELIICDEKSRNFEYRVHHDVDVERFRLKERMLKSELGSNMSKEKRKVLMSGIKACERKIQAPHVDVTFKTKIIRLKDLEVVIIPCELAASLGRLIKEASTAKVCYIWGYANGLTGYVVAASEFSNGVEGLSTLLPKGVAEEYVAKIIQNLIDED